MSDAIKTIFADRHRDDSEGIAAALADEPVVFNGTLYAPGEEITIENTSLVFRQRVYCTEEAEDESIVIIGHPAAPTIRVVRKPGARAVNILNNEIFVPKPQEIP